MSCKIIQCNIQSVEKNRAELTRIMVKEEYAIGLVSECWTKKEFENSKYKIPQYNNHYCSRFDGYGGAMILIHNSLLSRAIVIDSSDNIQCVGRYISKLELAVLSVYVAPNSSANEFKNFLSSLAKSIEGFKKVLIGGDFNSHHRLWDQYHADAKGAILFDFINDEDVILMNSGEPTFVPAEPNKKPSTIDLVLVSPGLYQDTSLDILQYGVGSRHLVLHIVVSNVKSPCQKFFLNRKKVKQELEKLDAVQVDGLSSLQRVTEKILKGAKQKNRFEPKFWWNEDVEVAWRNKNEARAKFNRSGTLEDLVELKKQEGLFARCKNKVIREKFREYIEEIDPNTSSKELWKKINGLTGKRRQRYQATIVHEEEEAANQFLNANFPFSTHCDLSISVTASYDILNVELWNDILSKKKKSSAPGPDGLSYEILKSLKPEVRNNIIRDLNRIWKGGRVDANMNKIKVIAIPKPGKNPEQIDNLRPISMLNCSLKIINAAVLAQLNLFVQQNTILPATSFGFRKHSSTTSCLNYVINSVNMIKRDGKVAGAIFIDLSSAYNTVKTEILEATLHEYGIPIELTNWIINFLRNRTIQMQVGNKLVERSIDDGLPQGDVLSPLLFNIYTAQLHSIVIDGVVLIQYADDFMAIVAGKNREEVQCRAQMFLDTFKAKSEQLQLKINESKTKVMLFQRNRKSLKLKIGDMVLETVNTHKYLGLTVDRSLSFGAHIREVKRNASDRINMLKVVSATRSGGHPQTLNMLYNAIVRSYLDYGASIYANSANSNLEKLTTINNTCLRKITGCSKTTPINSLCAIASQPPLQFRRKLTAAKEIIRHVQYQSPVWSQLRKLDDHDSRDVEKLTFQERIFEKYKHIFTKTSCSVQVQQNSSYIRVESELDDKPWHKKCTSTKTLKQLALGRLHSQYKDHRKIYTDASKDDAQCGVGVFDDRTKFKLSFKLENTVCTMSAELEAILIALQYMERNNIEGAVILTDSKSGCEFIKSQLEEVERCEIIQIIVEKAMRQRTCIQWIPGHVGLAGNEIADSLAKAGLHSNVIANNRLLPQDAYNWIKNDVFADLQQWYVNYTQELGKGRKFFKIQTGINPTSWFHNLPLNNSETRTLNRLLAGHDFSPYWLSKLKIKDDLYCDYCDCLNTSEHIIFECVKHLLPRDKHNLDKFYSIQQAFEDKNVDTLKNICKFLKDIKLNI